MANSILRFRLQAFQRQGGCCYYCELPMWERDPALFIQSHGVSPRQAKALRCTAEHLVPRCEGGRDCAANIVAACFHCNSRRHWRRVGRAAAAHLLHVRRRMAKGRWHGAWVFERAFGGAVQADGSR